MPMLSTVEPHFQSAMQACIAALRRLTAYTLEAPLAQRLESLSDRKEFLTPPEHEELVALLAFTQQRTIDKLEAEVALQRLETVLPELAIPT